MFTVKSFTPTETHYERIVAIQKANYPDLPMSVTRTKFGDENRNPQYLFQRLVVESDSSDAQAGQLVAVASYAEPSWSYRPGKYHIDIDVDPAWQEQGVGTLIYEHIMDVLANRSPAPTLLTTTTRENLPQSIRFLEKPGLQRAHAGPVHDDQGPEDADQQHRRGDHQQNVARLTFGQCQRRRDRDPHRRRRRHRGARSADEPTF